MAQFERVREVLAGPLTLEHLAEKTREGWKVAAIEWEREIAGQPAPQPTTLREQVPYGLRVSDDCAGLEENTGERQVLVLMMDLIVQDAPLSLVAEELNRKGLRTRTGANWTPGSVFDMLPRLIEVGPRIFSSSDWSARTRHLFRLV